MMRFYDDEPVECTGCGTIIRAGETYLKHPEGCFCSESCLGEFLVERDMKNIEFIDLLTADDHEDNYFDMRCHEMQDERLSGD